MNKKFSTLMAGLLLAGGMFSTVEASIQEMTPGQYYRMAVAAANGPASAYYLDSDAETGWYTAAEAAKADRDGSSWWTVEQILDPVTKEPIAFKLVNKLGVYYKVTVSGKTYDTFAAQSNDVSVSVSNGTLTLYWALPIYGENLYAYEGVANVSSSNIWGFDNEAMKPYALNKAELGDKNGDSFSIQIGYQEDKNQDGKNEWYEYTSFEGENVFAGNLYVEEGTNGFALYKDAKHTQRVVLTTEKWNKTSADLGEGYIFDVLNTKEYAAAVAAGDKIQADEFIISAPATVQGDPIEVVVTNGTNKYELVVSVVKNAAGKEVNRLTVADAKTDNTADYNKQNGGNTYVKFGASNLIDMTTFIGKIWNIEKDGKIASPERWSDYVPTSQVAKAYPEGQWLWNNATQTFVNRESGKTLPISGLREDANPKDNVYVTADGATYTFTEAGTPGETTLGYLNGYTEDQLKYNAFVIGSPIATTQDTIYLANGKNGVLTFTEDKAEAVQFNLTIAPECEKHANAQIRNEYTAWKDQAAKTTEQKTDVINFLQYTITEALTGKVLCYDYTNKCYALATQKELNENPNLSDAGKFLFKNKGVDTYNIVRGEYSNSLGGYIQGIYTVQDAKHSYHATVPGLSFCGGIYGEGNTSYADAYKLYNAFQSEKLVQSEDLYRETQNDLFVITPALAEQYRSDFSNEGVLDTIKIFRNDDPSYVLYEQGTLLANAKGEAVEGFLGMENVLDPQYATKQPAMLADTAFHANTYRPQYMLAVDAQKVAAGKYCDICGSSDCPHAKDTKAYVSGRYLVNLIDSAKAVTTGANKFKHEGFNRLGFVQAKHIGDSLIIASTNDTIDLAANRPNDKVCTFAFKYVDAAREAFTIETLGDYTVDADGDVTEVTTGYIKYQNGVPVVTLKASEAWVFNLNVLTGEENAPTANENISAANVVVAGVDGAVVVKGAEGKNVIVSTILGKVVANETVSSDNATIAAPQGVVVVSVDGESFKVVVK